MATPSPALLDAIAPLNQTIPIENGLFRGSILVRTSTGPGSERHAAYFAGRRRCLEIQVQGRFLVPVLPGGGDGRIVFEDFAPPRRRSFASMSAAAAAADDGQRTQQSALQMGGELATIGGMPLGLMGRGVTSMLIRLMKTASRGKLVAGTGSKTTRPHLLFPLLSLPDHLIVTGPGRSSGNGGGGGGGGGGTENNGAAGAGIEAQASAEAVACGGDSVGASASARARARARATSAVKAVKAPQVGAGEWNTPGSIPKAARRNHPDCRGEWGADDVVSFSLHTMYMDLARWRLSSIPGAKTMELKKFWGDSAFRIVLFDIVDGERRMFVNVEVARPGAEGGGGATGRVRQPVHLPEGIEVTAAAAAAVAVAGQAGVAMKARQAAKNSPLGSYYGDDDSSTSAGSSLLLDSATDEGGVGRGGRVDDGSGDAVGATERTQRREVEPSPGRRPTAIATHPNAHATSNRASRGSGSGSGNRADTKRSASSDANVAPLVLRGLPATDYTLVWQFEPGTPDMDDGGGGSGGSGGRGGGVWERGASGEDEREGGGREGSKGGEGGEGNTAVASPQGGSGALMDEARQRTAFENDGRNPYSVREKRHIRTRSVVL
jgi:hypothetical protein